MTQEDTKLVLKDLCSRLPYGVIALTEKGKGHICDINLTIFGAKIGININPDVRDTFSIDDVKPYLFPLSSMTEEQKKEYQYITERWMYDSSYSISDSTDWLNKNHFDYRNLIDKNLAIDATGLNIY